jgi:hypothetical protein
LQFACTERDRGGCVSRFPTQRSYAGAGQPGGAGKEAVAAAPATSTRSGRDAAGPRRAIALAAACAGCSSDPGSPPRPGLRCIALLGMTAAATCRLDRSAWANDLLSRRAVRQLDAFFGRSARPASSRSMRFAALWVMDLSAGSSA